MSFCDKLDFLMNITKTSNSTLSLYTSLDASHISRLRRGQRALSKNGDYARSMASYFAKRCVEDYQHKALCDALNLNHFSADDPQLPDLILSWFLDEERSGLQSVDSFLANFSAFKAKKSPLPDPEAAETEVTYPRPETSVYFGISGKRQAAIQFLTDVVACPNPQTLLLFSDEDMDWQTGDRNFTAQWASLMVQMISRGNRIKIIHTVSRDLDEMLNAISQWMPLYMSGAIEPYFYPKKRDGIFKKTLFIAPASAAVVSSSVGSMQEQAAIHLFRNSRTIASFQEEFNQYLALCRPLMRVYLARDQEAYLANLLEFEKESADTLITSESISLLTMPEVVANSIVRRQQLENPDFFTHSRQRAENFHRTLRHNSITEIIHLPDLTSLQQGKIKISFSDLFFQRSVYYTAEEYLNHLENIIRLLETCKNYHICLDMNMKDPGYVVYVKEERGALVAKTSTPPVILSVDESNMSAAFWNFLQHMIAEKSIGNPDNRENAKKLRDYVKRMRGHLS